jgi:hypothetical protein
MVSSGVKFKSILPIIVWPKSSGVLLVTDGDVSCLTKGDLIHALGDNIILLNGKGSMTAQGDFLLLLLCPP